MDLLELRINGETFSFNEGNGADVVGSAGTVATVNTSHAGGLNYINQEVIQPIYGSGKQRKRVLDRVNQDYILLNTSYTLADGEYVEFKCDNDFVNTWNYPIGSTQAGLAIRSDRAIIRDDSGSTTTGIYLGGALTPDQMYIYRFERSGTSIDIIVDNVSQRVVTIGSGDTFTFDRIGRRGGDYMTSGIEYVDFNGELFSFNEGNGATVTSSNGNTATISTSHAGGLNYINHEVIKPI